MTSIIPASLVPSPIRSAVSVDSVGDRLRNLPAIDYFQYTQSRSASGNQGWTPVEVVHDVSNNRITMGKTPEGGAWLSKRDGDGGGGWEKQWNIINALDNVVLADVTTDRAGNIYLLGSFSQRLVVGRTVTGEELTLTTQPVDRGPTILPYPLPTSGYDVDLFVAKFDAAGNAVWARQFGGFNSTESAGQLVSDAQGDVYFSGTFGRTITKFGQDSQGRSVDRVAQSPTDLFLTKLNGQGQTVWVQTFEGRELVILLPMPNYPETSDWLVSAISYPPRPGSLDLVIDSQDRLYLAGQLGELQPKLFQVSAAGQVLDQRHLDVAAGGFHEVQLAVGGSDRLYVASRKDYDHVYLWGSNGIELMPMYDRPNRGVLLQQYDVSGQGINPTIVWQRTISYQGAHDFDLAIDRMENLYLTGIFQRDTVQFGQNAVGRSISVANLGPVEGSASAYIAKFTAAGTVVWAKSFGGLSMEGNRVSIDRNDQVMLSGAIVNWPVIPGDNAYASRRFWAGVEPEDGVLVLPRRPSDSGLGWADGFVMRLGAEQSVEPLSQVYEVLWQNQTTGDRELWTFPGNTLEITVKAWSKETEAGWEFVGRGDFDRDGDGDVFWYNRLSGLSKIEYVAKDGTTTSKNVTDRQGRVFQAGNSLDWQAQAIGDFDQDGWLDVFWLNQRTGETGYWLMQDSQLLGGQMTKFNISDPEQWRVTGAGDYDRDGNIDFYWYNSVTGGGGFWKMNRTTFVQAILLPEALEPQTAITLPGGGRSRSRQLIAGGRDLDGDGYLDLYRYDMGTQSNNPIYLKGFNVDSRPELTILIPTPGNSQIRGVEDFDGDGQMEFLFFNQEIGQSVLWSRRLTLSPYPTLPKRSADWEILDLRRGSAS
jgi:hypothetical protein